MCMLRVCMFVVSNSVKCILEPSVHSIVDSQC